MYVCMYVCMYVSSYVRMYVCTCMYVCMYVCTYVYMYLTYLSIHLFTVMHFIISKKIFFLFSVQDLEREELAVEPKGKQTHNN